MLKRIVNINVEERLCMEMDPYHFCWYCMMFTLLNLGTVLCTTVVSGHCHSHRSCVDLSLYRQLSLSCQFVCGWHGAWLSDCPVRCYDEDALSAFCWLCLFLCERSFFYSVLFLGGRHPSIGLPVCTASENCLHFRVICFSSILSGLLCFLPQSQTVLCVHWFSSLFRSSL